MASIQFDTREFDNRQIKDQNKRLKKLKQAYEKFYKQIAAIGAATGFNDPVKEFYLKDYPQAEKDLNALLRQLCDQMTANIEDGNKEAWSIADSKNSALIASLAADNGWDGEIISRIKERSAEALSAFQARKVDGMGLSERIWKSQAGTMQQIEMALELGLSQGKGAAALSRDVRQYLNEPNRLFRRVRDKDGELRLSKAAQAYHPGRGKYRSSYKNALRLTTTETNMAYRTADHVAHQGMPFVLGFEIHLSGNHPVEDICDELKGIYPKEFKFVGWHPFCRCYTTTVLPSRKELNEWASSTDEEREKYHFSNEVKGMPKQFTDWTEKNAERLAKAKNQPYFIKDNFKGGKIDGGLNWLAKPKPTKPLTILEKAKIRQAARTPEQIEAIKLAAKDRQHQLNHINKVVESLFAKDSYKTSAARDNAMAKLAMRALGDDVDKYLKMDAKSKVDWQRLFTTLHPDMKKYVDFSALRKEQKGKIFELLKRVPRERIAPMSDHCVIIHNEVHGILSHGMYSAKKAEQALVKRYDSGYIATRNYKKINTALREDDIKSLTPESLKTVKTLDMLCDYTSLGYPVKVVRNVDGYGACGFFGIEDFMPKSMVNMTHKELVELCDKINSGKGLGTDKAFMSTSTNAMFNAFSGRQIQLEYIVPQGKKFYLSDHVVESEAIFGRNTRAERLQSASIEKIKDVKGVLQERIVIKMIIL